MTVRLNMDKRRAILRAAHIAAGYGPDDEQKMENERQVHYVQACENILKDERDADTLKVLAALPEDIRLKLKTPGHVNIQIGDDHIRFFVRANMDRTPQLAGWKYMDGARQYGPRSAVGKQVRAGEKLKADFDQGKSQLFQDLWPILTGSTTVKQLLDIWPEGERFVSEVDKPGKPGALVPIETIRRINAAVGKGEYALPDGLVFAGGVISGIPTKASK